MLAIDTETMRIALTRGDTASIEFSAKKPNGSNFSPIVGDILRFVVTKKRGGSTVFEVANTYDSTLPDALTQFWTITIGAPNSNDWYQKDSDGNVVLDSNGEPAYIKFGDYKYDVEIITETGKDTIIGKTDDIDPIFTVWDENE